MEKRNFNKVNLLTVFLLWIGISIINNQFIYSQAVNHKWYVDNAAAGANNGTSWTDAWQDFTAIPWTQVQPGDTIYISGGVNEKTYNEPIDIVDKGGTDGNPITIKVGQDIGHNGNVIITSSGTFAGIFIMKPYITVDGNYNGERRIIIKDCSGSGIYVYGGEVHHINLTYLEISHNGNESNSHGIRININDYNARPILEVSRCSIDDNYQDQIAGVTSTFAPDFGYISIHDNIISHLNDDGFECGIGGVDFYNNEMFGKSYDGGEGHPDGLQFYGEYYRIYNNKFHDINVGNAYIYIEPFSALGIGRPVESIYIYNNLIYETEVLPQGYALRGIDFGPYDPNQNIFPVSNVVIANNVVVNMPTGGINLDLANVVSADVNNVTIANNIVHNCYTNTGGIAYSVHAIPDGVTVGSAGSGAQIIFDHNILSPGNNGSNLFYYKRWGVTQNEMIQDYSLNIHGANLDPSLNAEYKPDNSNDPTVDTGLNLSRYFTIDLDSVSRPQGAGWDIGAYEYVSSDGVALEQEVASAFQLYQNYPNPFNPSTTIHYSLPVACKLSLKIYDILGREITTLVNEMKTAGTHTVQWDGRNSAGQREGSGVYIYCVEYRGRRMARQMVLIK